MFYNIGICKICAYSYTHYSLRGNGQNDLLREVCDQKYLNTTVREQMMLLKHLIMTTSLFYLKSLHAYPVFFRTKFKLLVIAFKSQCTLWFLPTFPHPSFTSHTQHCIFSYHYTFFNAKHTHFLPFRGTELLQKLSYLMLVKQVFVQLIKSIKASKWPWYSKEWFSCYKIQA